MKAWGVEEQDAVRMLGDVPLNIYRAFKDYSDHARLGEELLTRISFRHRPLQGAQNRP
jgi:hypothetical protein